MGQGQLTVLGGGPAGMAVSYYALRNGLEPRMYEAGECFGGNSRTFQEQRFRFDSGAHRFHDKDPGVTRDLKELVGERLRRVDAGSQIYHDGKLIDFPLSPFNLLHKLGVPTFARATAQILLSRRRERDFPNFEAFATQRYGEIISQSFLLNYSEKLWGIPCRRLAVSASGSRLRHLNLKAFLAEALLGNRAKTAHLESSRFYYPDQGIGMIVEAILRLLPHGSRVANARITRAFHRDGQIAAVEINGKERTEIDRVVSTLPLDHFIGILDPPPPREILERAGRLRFRHLVLVALFLKRASVSRSATLYFPETGIPFTRVYEPRNRFPGMAPAGYTSLVAEIPCWKSDDVWAMGTQEARQMVVAPLQQAGFIDPSEIIAVSSRRLENAYPVLEAGLERDVAQLRDYLAGFRNLRLSGRNARFEYVWLHNVFRSAKEIIREFVES